MAGFHIDRISEDIKREIVSIMRELKDPRISDMLTVVKVDVSGDLSYAKVYISVLDKENGERVLKGLRSASGWLRRELGSALKLRYTPELVFQLDDSIDKGAHILELLRSVEGPKE